MFVPISIIVIVVAITVIVVLVIVVIVIVVTVIFFTCALATSGAVASEIVGQLNARGVVVADVGRCAVPF